MADQTAWELQREDGRVSSNLSTRGVRALIRTEYLDPERAWCKRSGQWLRLGSEPAFADACPERGKERTSNGGVEGAEEEGGTTSLSAQRERAAHLEEVVNRKEDELRRLRRILASRLLDDVAANAAHRTCERAQGKPR